MRACQPRSTATYLCNFKFMTEDKNVYAAIAMAIHEYKDNNRHDRESGKITIANKDSEWNSHSQTMTVRP